MVRYSIFLDKRASDLVVDLAVVRDMRPSTLLRDLVTALLTDPKFEKEVAVLRKGVQ